MTEITSRLSTALADRYRIERHLGTGGMATVYLAEDLKHKRKVALKVLKPDLAAVLGADRFVQEITTTASLQHPHILPLFDSGEADSFLYYVMPFIDGETLRDKLNRETQLGIDEAVGITTDVADALHYAHGEGVIHRDIKPENILLHNGRPMVADFGIALAVSAAAGGRMTETGLSLGTPHYMSPEQATAEKELTSRADIYSLGAVLYEMLTGNPPHVGSSAQQTIMRIVTDEARPVSELRKSVPANVAAATAQALEKLPADRFETAAAFGEALRDQAFTASRMVATMPQAGAASWWNPLSYALAGSVVALVALVLWIMTWPAGRGPVAYDVGLPDSAPMFLEFGTLLSVSPTGAFVVYIGDGNPRWLWYRSLTDRTVLPIPGTDNASRALALSPDGDRVAFFADGRVKVVSVSGGSITTLADAFTPTGMQWISNSQVFFNDGGGVALRWLDVDTGDEQNQFVEHCINPQLLPDAEHVLCGGGGNQHAVVWGLSDSSKQFVRTGNQEDSSDASVLRGADFRLIDDAYLTYMSVAGDLRAVPFDASTLRTGRSIAVLPGVRREAFTGAGQWGVSANGTLVFAEGLNADVGQLVVVTPDSQVVPLVDEAAHFLRYDVTPDGRRLAAVVVGVREHELRIYDLSTGSLQNWLSAGLIGEPLWNAAGDSLTVNVSNVAGDRWAMLVGSPNSAAPPDTLFSGVEGAGYELFSSYDDRLLVGNNWNESPRAIAVDLSTSPPQMDTLVNDAVFATLSPDARWLAYNTDGLEDLFITPYPSRERRFLVTQNGIEPQWLSPTELVYWVVGRGFYRVRITASADNPVGVPRFWYYDPRFSDTPGHSYTLTADGSLVYVRSPEQRPATYLRVIPNWVEEMKRAVDAANR